MRSHLTKLVPITGALAALGLFWGIAEAPRSLIPQEPEPLTVLFFGDMMLDRGVARRAAVLGDTAALVAGVQGLAHSADLVVLNLEGTITTNESIAQRDNTILRFTFAPELARGVLGALGVDAVSLANNHGLDFYQAGYDTTVEYLGLWGVAPFGHPLNSQNLSTTLVHEGRAVCLVGYHELFQPDTTAVIEELGRLRPVCFKLVVFAHWGPEYEPPSVSQSAKGRAFIDAGADMVVGAHPHVVQPIEIYQGKPIIYSLGNFVFDQDFSWETRHGLALKAQFSDTATTLTFIPLAIVESRPTIAEGDAYTRVIEAAGGLDSLTLP